MEPSGSEREVQIQNNGEPAGGQRSSYPEGLAVELYFDPESEEKIRSFREFLYQQGIKPVLGLMNDKPHISLAVLPSMDPAKLIRVSQEFAEGLEAFKFQLSALGVFPTKDNVLFLYPVPDQKLLVIHNSFHEWLKKHKIVSSSYYHPENWVPHCTLEYNLTDADLRKSISVSKRAFDPIKGQIKQIGVVAFRPIDYLIHFDLKERKNVR